MSRCEGPLPFPVKVALSSCAGQCSPLTRPTPLSHNQRRGFAVDFLRMRVALGSVEPTRRLASRTVRAEPSSTRAKRPWVSLSPICVAALFSALTARLAVAVVADLFQRAFTLARAVPGGRSAAMSTEFSARLYAGCCRRPRARLKDRADLSLAVCRCHAHHARSRDSLSAAWRRDDHLLLRLRWNVSPYGTDQHCRNKACDCTYGNVDCHIASRLPTYRR